MKKVVGCKNRASMGVLIAAASVRSEHVDEGQTFKIRAIYSLVLKQNPPTFRRSFNVAATRDDSFCARYKTWKYNVL